MSNSDDEQVLQPKDVSVFNSKNAQDIVKNISEVFLDSLTESDFIKSISGVGLIVNTWGLKSDFERVILRNKIVQFMHPVNHVPEHKKQSFLLKIQANNKLKHDIGIHLTEMLSSLDAEKTRIIGNLFVLVIKEDIDYIYYLKLVHFVKTAFYYDLIKLRNGVDENGVVIGPTPDTDGLVSIDLKGHFEDAVNDRKSEPYEHTHLTDEGRMIVLVGMKDL